MIRIQKPTVKDIHGIQEVFYKTWLETYPNKKFGILEEDIEERYKNRNAKENIEKRTKYLLNIPKNDLYLIAKDEEKVVGVCIFIKKEKFNELQAIYVLPKYQGKGIGRMFWGEVNKFSDKNKDIVVHLAVYNKNAMIFYTKLGFVDTGKRFRNLRFKMPVSGVVLPEMEMIIKQNTKKNKKVYVGMSGGVDSSVSAALLKNQGYDVTGVFIKVWQPEFFECTWKQDRLDAMRVCAKLNIPFVTLNLEKEYKKEVVDYMIREYKIGKTPNPDVMCNKYVKFGGFFDWAMKQGADFVATGHYARTKKIAGKTQILAGTDKNKDQSYFLWTLTQKQLSKTIFSVGDIEKPEVRKLAEKFGLSTAVKKDSQGLCFIGKIDIKDFLKNYIKETKGKVLDENGKVIGEHDGAFYLTIGQRHGFKITKKTPNDSAYYIINKDIKNNTIRVSQDSSKIIESDSKIIELNNVNWILEEEPDLSNKYSARIRYRQPLEECKIIKTAKNKFELHFTKSQKAVTSGQSAVIYDGEICLGGGIIS